MKNKKGFAPLFTVLCWAAGAFVIGTAAGGHSASQRLTEKCVSNGGTHDACASQVKGMSFRNKMLALQR